MLNQPQLGTVINSEAYYLQAEFFVFEKLSLYTRYERLYLIEEDKKGTTYALLTGNTGSTRFAESQVLGARWYATPDLSMTAEYSHNDGNAFLLGADDIDYRTLKNKWDLFILQFSYHF